MMKRGLLLLLVGAMLALAGVTWGAYSYGPGNCT